MWQDWYVKNEVKTKSNKLYIIWIIDNNFYLLNNAAIIALNKEHSISETLYCYTFYK